MPLAYIITPIINVLKNKSVRNECKDKQEMFPEVYKVGAEGRESRAASEK